MRKTRDKMENSESRYKNIKKAFESKITKYKQKKRRDNQTIREGILNEVHAPVRINYPRKFYKLRSIYQCMHADLMEIPKLAEYNDGTNFLLVVINIFSKFVYVKPLKDKSAKTVCIAFEDILKNMIYIPNSLSTDLGTEFTNKKFRKLLKKHKIHLYHSTTIKKAVFAERLIRDLRRLIYKGINARGNYHFLDILPLIVDHMNNTENRMIKMKPVDVTIDNEHEVIRRYKEIEKQKAKKICPNNEKRKPKFQVGDDVRMSTYRKLFDKETSFSENWTYETYKIKKVILSCPHTYVIVDNKGEYVAGLFYEQELKSTKYPNIYLVKEVLERNKETNQDKVVYLGMNHRIKDNDNGEKNDKDNNGYIWVDKNQYILM